MGKILKMASAEELYAKEAEGIKALLLTAMQAAQMLVTVKPVLLHEALALKNRKELLLDGIAGFISPASKSEARENLVAMLKNLAESD